MKPKISIVVAAYNEEKLLPRFLHSLKNQTYPREQYEVIVVNNGSTDTTEQIAKAWGAKVYTYTDIQGCGPARAYGSKKAQGEIIAYIDADCVVPSDWLKKIDTLFSNSQIVAVGGRAVPDTKSAGIAVIFTFYDYFHLINNALHKPILWGFNMAVRKKAYDKIGGINLALLSSEDWDLAFRLQKQFGKNSVRYVRSLTMQTSTRKQSDAKVFFRYAMNGVRNYIDYVILGKVKATPIFNVR